MELVGNAEPPPAPEHRRVGQARGQPNSLPALGDAAGSRGKPRLVPVSAWCRSNSASRPGRKRVDAAVAGSGIAYRRRLDAFPARLDEPSTHSVHKNSRSTLNNSGRLPWGHQCALHDSCSTNSSRLPPLPPVLAISITLLAVPVGRHFLAVLISFYCSRHARQLPGVNSRPRTLGSCGIPRQQAPTVAFTPRKWPVSWFRMRLDCFRIHCKVFPSTIFQVWRPVDSLRTA